MAKKKIKTCEGYFQDLKNVFTRIGLNEFQHYNNTLLSKKDSISYHFVLGSTLMQLLLNDDDFKDIKEVDVHSESIVFLENCALNEGWIDIDVDASLLKGKLMPISVDGSEYEIMINRDLFPLKLKKSESKDLYYKTYINKTSVILIIKKLFASELDGCEFSVSRLFKVINK